jgi:hypothetical protein
VARGKQAFDADHYVERDWLGWKFVVSCDYVGQGDREEA